MKFLSVTAAGIAVAMFGATSAAIADAESDYKTACFACHDMGVAGAPKLGDTENWAPRLEQGKETLYKHAIEGYQGSAGYMPPRGGSTLSDDAIKAVVDYMVAQSQ